MEHTNPGAADGYRPAPTTAKNVTAFSAFIDGLSERHKAAHRQPEDEAEPPQVETTMAEAEKAAASSSAFTRGDLLRSITSGGAWRDLAPLILLAPERMAFDADEVPADVFSEAYALFSKSSARLASALLS